MLHLRLPPHLFPVGHLPHTFVLSRLIHSSLPLLIQPSSDMYSSLIQQVFIEQLRVPGSVPDAGDPSMSDCTCGAPLLGRRHAKQGDPQIVTSLQTLLSANDVMTRVTQREAEDSGLAECGRSLPSKEWTRHTWGRAARGQEGS